MENNKIELNKIQSNLSFSYLHAVVSRAGGICEQTNRDADNMGIDARLTFSGKKKIKIIDINVQLKSIRQKPIIVDNKIHYSLTAKQFDKYTQKSTTPFLFILFHVPDNPKDWLSLSENELILKKCSYWTSLTGAPPCEGNSTTIFIPTKNLFSVEQLQTLINKLSEEKELRYES
ncbi:MAG: DUF4365 domain-containing protein [Planctomycetaceae bacterium]|jgi:hypothetical protein|nr:DUF4365 domain-containing protein [Planctomycetaceae bacterium]